jgi:NAD+ synthase (glutamine-hydrolysing)
VESAAKRVAQLADSEAVTQPAVLAKAVLTTVYMGTVNSSSATRERAQRLADQIGADHLDVKLDSAVSAMAQLFSLITGRTPRFRVANSSPACPNVGLNKT